MRLASNIALLAVVILAIALNYSNVIRIRDLEVIVAGAGLFLGAFGIGYIFGGPDPETRKVLGLSAAVRNASVAFLIAVENFPGTTVINYLVVLGIVAIPSSFFWRLPWDGGVTGASPVPDEDSPSRPADVYHRFGSNGDLCSTPLNRL